jgi:arsenical pump membrane protein
MEPVPALNPDWFHLSACGLVLCTTVGIALGRPRIRGWGRLGPAHAAVVAVLAVLLTGSAAPLELAVAYRQLIRPFAAIAGIMVMTACVSRSGLLEAFAGRFLNQGNFRAGGMFTLSFFFAAGLSSVLNNDAMILLLTPLVLALAREGWPGQPKIHRLQAYAVFAAIGVAPVVIANPINLLVSDQAGIGFNRYWLHMVPVAALCWVVTWGILIALFRRELRPLRNGPSSASPGPFTPQQKLTTLVLGGIVVAYPVASMFHEWAVAVVSVVGALVLLRVVRAPPKTLLLREVEWGILLFMLGAFGIGLGLQNAGAVDGLAGVYRAGGLTALAAISATGSAALNNHPMTILNLLTLQSTSTPDLHYLIVLAGGDLGPRLLPSGSLAGLLWLAACRKQGVRVPLRWFVTTGAITLIPALLGAVVLLVFLNP